MPRKGRPRTRAVHYGNCEHCGERFESVTNKYFCSLSCYAKSEKMATRLRGFNNTRLNRVEATCSCCGSSLEFKASRVKSRNFCSQRCYRKFLAEAFDRWIASPQAIALPQCYDEFMMQQSLPCLVDGCDWEGQHLSAHACNVHGIKADELKRAAGFNLSTGLVSAPLHERLCKQNSDKGTADIAEFGSSNKLGIVGYISLEGKEHRRKAAILRRINSD